MPKAITSPCVGICSSGIGDDVCRGCKRFANEVIEWNAYSQEQRALIQQRLDNFLIQIIKLKIQLIDIKKLGFTLKEEHITFDENLDAHLWVYQLIKSRYREHIEPRVWGFKVRSPFQDLSMAALHESIEKEFYNLSQAHYERYVQPGIVRANRPR
ncbi:MAG: DUF1289 domain-containing protein [Porticoccaceae bacterium]|nr:DUF1289 domain-containing protein [Porticoccaceae bacterium]